MNGSANWSGILVKTSVLKLNKEASSHISLKLDKANSLGIRVLSEKEFLEIVN